MKKAFHFAILLSAAVSTQALAQDDPNNYFSLTYSAKGQAQAPSTQAFGKEAFASSDKTTLRWMGMAGFLINSRGTTLMVDPLLEGFDMPVLIDFPIKSKDVPRVDAILVTHSDNDHFSIPTCRALSSVTRAYHSTVYVDSLMKNESLPSFGHPIGHIFDVGQVRVTVTPADHAWQNAYPGTSKRHFENEDCAGFWIETPDGTIWAPGDSRLIPEHHLKMPAPDAMLFDFSNSEWHFTLEGAVKMANAYPNTPLLLHHWGSVDAPDFAPFNGNPNILYKMVVNPERIRVLAPGEPFTLKRLKSQMVRLAKLVIDPAQLENYKSFLKEEIEASVRLEPGVLTLYAVSEKNNPTHITILEIYADEDAYKAHIQTPHFLKYKTGTKEMVKSLELVETDPLVPGMKIK